MDEHKHLIYTLEKCAAELKSVVALATAAICILDDHGVAGIVALICSLISALECHYLERLAKIYSK